MIIEIKHPIAKEKVIEAIQRASAEVAKKSLRKHFDKLQRNLNSAFHQKILRNDFV